MGKILRLFGLAAVAALLGACATIAAETQNPTQLTDLELIDSIHAAGPNWKWEPEWAMDHQERQPVHLLTLSQSDIKRVCGEGALACTATPIPADRVDDLNELAIRSGATEQQLVEAGSCVIFMPERDSEYPKLWFYLLGHEFAHCRYGNYHPIDIPVGDDV